MVGRSVGGLRELLRVGVAKGGMHAPMTPFRMACPAVLLALSSVSLTVSAASLEERAEMEKAARWG